MAQILFIIFTFIILLAILWIFLKKADLQLQYLRLSRGVKASPGEFLKFKWQDTKSRNERWEAFLLFPMLIPLELGQESTELTKIKRGIKRIHIGIYLMLILLIIMGISSERVFL
jgi:hypothetical protein